MKRATTSRPAVRGEREANEVLFRSGEGEGVWREKLQVVRLERVCEECKP